MDLGMTWMVVYDSGRALVYLDLFKGVNGFRDDLDGSL